MSQANQRSVRRRLTLRSCSKISAERRLISLATSVTALLGAASCEQATAAGVDGLFMAARRPRAHIRTRRCWRDL